MTPEAYFYISLAYLCIAIITTFTLCLKGYIGYQNSKYLLDFEKKKKWKPLQYLLHSFHIPPYLIASYWYYDSYIEYKSKENTLLAQ